MEIIRDNNLGRFRRDRSQLRFEEMTVPFSSRLTFQNRVLTVRNEQNTTTQRYICLH